MTGKHTIVYIGSNARGILLFESNSSTSKPWISNHQNENKFLKPTSQEIYYINMKITFQNISQHWWALES